MFAWFPLFPGEEENDATTTTSQQQQQRSTSSSPRSHLHPHNHRNASTQLSASPSSRRGSPPSSSSSTRRLRSVASAPSEKEAERGLFGNLLAKLGSTLSVSGGNNNSSYYDRTVRNGGGVAGGRKHNGARGTATFVVGGCSPTEWTSPLVEASAIARDQRARHPSQYSSSSSSSTMNKQQRNRGKSYYYYDEASSGGSGSDSGGDSWAEHISAVADDDYADDGPSMMIDVVNASSSRFDEGELVEADEAEEVMVGLAVKASKSTGMGPLFEERLEVMASAEVQNGWRRCRSSSGGDHPSHYYHQEIVVLDKGKKQKQKKKVSAGVILLDLLPNELCLLILSHLEPKELCLQIAPLSKRWNLLARDNCLWRDRFYKEWQGKRRIQPSLQNSSFNAPSVRNSWYKKFQQQKLLHDNWMNPTFTPHVIQLKGHTKGVRALHFQNDILYSGAKDSKIKIWDMNSGQCLHTLPGAKDCVQSLRMDGHTLVNGGGSADPMVREWDVNTQTCVRVYKGHDEWICCIRFDGNIIMSSSDDQSVRLWDRRTGQCIHSLNDHYDTVWCLQYDEDKVLTGTAAGDRVVRIWDRRTLRCRSQLQGHRGGVYSLQYDGDMLWTGSTGQIKNWDLTNNQCLKTFDKEHSYFVMGLQFDGVKMVSGGYDTYVPGVRIWDVQNSKVLKTLSGHSKAIRCLHFDSEKLASGSLDKTILVWNFKTGPLAL
ncbi:F-box/WD repeat-containing protein 7 [Balamuthia mandrillaris]